MVGDIPQVPPGFQPRAGPAGGAGSCRRPADPRGHRDTGGGQDAARGRLRAGEISRWLAAGGLGQRGRSRSAAGGPGRGGRGLGLADGRTGRGGGDAGRAVRDWLERDGRRCLVVFDNALDPDGIRPLLPACGSARVLITGSRRPVASLGAGVPVDVFSPDEALAFLAELTGLADTAGASALARELGYLPLALAQAAGAIAAQDLAYWTYLGPAAGHAGQRAPDPGGRTAVPAWRGRGHHACPSTRPAPVTGPGWIPGSWRSRRCCQPGESAGSCCMTPAGRACWQPAATGPRCPQTWWTRRWRGWRSGRC